MMRGNYQIKFFCCILTIGYDLIHLQGILRPSFGVEESPRPEYHPRNHFHE
jgi:hypothetical protein